MKLITADYLVIFAILLFVTTHSITNYMILSYQDIARTIGKAESSIILFEKNPISAWLFQLGNFKYIYSFVIMPAILTSLYYIVRRKYDVAPNAVMAFAIALFMAAFLNVMNDLSVLLGFLSSL